MKNRSVLIIASCTIGLLTGSVSANPIELTCQNVEKWHNCQLLLEEMSPANRNIEVLNLNNERMSQTKTDNLGRFRYLLPETTFYLLVDIGPGHVFDIDLTSDNYRVSN